MKLSQQINHKPVPFECDGTTWYMKKLTINDAKKLEESFKGIEEDDLEVPIMMVFRDVLVGEDGLPFEEIRDGATFEDLCELIPVTTLRNLIEAVAAVMSGGSDPN